MTFAKAMAVTIIMGLASLWVITVHCRISDLQARTARVEADLARVERARPNDFGMSYLNCGRRGPEKWCTILWTDKNIKEEK